MKRAKKLRQETGDDRYWAPLERNTMPLGQRIKHVLGGPFVVLVNEPMLIAITLYMSVRLTSFHCRVHQLTVRTVHVWLHILVI